MGKKLNELLSRKKKTKEKEGRKSVDVSILCAPEKKKIPNKTTIA
jgi:hypothetical protein